MQHFSRKSLVIIVTLFIVTLIPILLAPLGLASPLQSNGANNGGAEVPLPVTVEVNGVILQFTGAQPVLAEGRVHVPVHELFLALGYTGTWNLRRDIVTYSNGVNIVVIPAGQAHFYLNRQRRFLHDSTTMQFGTVVLPLRSISEAVGARVEWDESAWRARIWTTTTNIVPLRPR